MISIMQSVAMLCGAAFVREGVVQSAFWDSLPAGQNWYCSCCAATMSYVGIVVVAVRSPRRSVLHNSDRLLTLDEHPVRCIDPLSRKSSNG